MKRPLGIAAVASAATALVLVQTGAAGPGALGTYFFGPKLVRAEVVMNEGGSIHDYRVDRGRLRAATASSVTLLERDGTLVTVPVAADAVVRAGGRVVPLQRLPRGLLVTTIRDNDAPAEQVMVGR